jgi:hypothetical protein
MKRSELPFCFAIVLALACYSAAARSQETMSVPSVASALTVSDVQKIIGNLSVVQPSSVVPLPVPLMEEGNPAGPNIGMTSKWDNGFWVTTPQKNFTMHTGVWVQFDAIWGFVR